MNQQELADEQIYKRGYNAGFEAGALLAKQQADRITELEKALTQYRIENFIEGEYGQTITLAELRKTELYHNVRKQLTKPTYLHKQLSDEEIEKIRLIIMETAYWCADENMPEAYNAVKVCCSKVLAIIKEITE